MFVLFPHVAPFVRRYPLLIGMVSTFLESMRHDSGTITLKMLFINVVGEELSSHNVARCPLPHVLRIAQDCSLCSSHLRNDNPPPSDFLHTHQGVTTVEVRQLRADLRYQNAHDLDHRDGCPCCR